MATANVLDPGTWTTCSLETTEGSIRFWVLADPNQYYEQFTDNGNLISVPIAVAWDDAATFKRYALGFTEYRSGSTYFERQVPLLCPYTNALYLSDLKKIGLHAGVSTGGLPAFAEADPLADNWFSFPATDGMPPRIVYQATFGNLPYRVIDQDTFRSGDSSEMRRYVVREEQTLPRERKTPNFGYETDDAAATPVPEVGFVPFYELELTYTWKRIPFDRVPRTAIQNCLIRVNAAAFDPAVNPGKYPVESVLFKGLAGRITPYIGPNSELLVDVPYVFSFLPTGWNVLPRNNGTTVRIRARGTASNPAPLYRSDDFAALFQPQPDVAVYSNLPPSTYERSSILSGQYVIISFGVATTGFTPASYLWDFGDGGSATTATAEHSFTAAGTYTVSVTCTDAEGNTKTGSRGPFVIV